MLALENCRVIVGCVEAAHIFPSFLAGDIRVGRLGVPVNRYAARLLVGDADWSIPLYGLHSPIIPPSVERTVPKRTVGEWVRFDVMASLFFQWAWFRRTLRPCRKQPCGNGTARS